MGILDCGIIHLTKVHAKPHGPILLLYHHHWESQGLVEGLITSSRNISFTCCCSMSLTIGFCRRNGSRVGGPVVWISCSTRDVLLMGLPSLENTSWYSSMSCRRSLYCSKESKSGICGNWPPVGDWARWTEEIVPTSHSGIRVISPSVRLSNWTATLEPSLRVGKPNSPSGRWSLGSNRVNAATVLARKKTRDLPAGITTFWLTFRTSKVTLSGLRIASLDLPLIWTSSLLMMSFLELRLHLQELIVPSSHNGLSQNPTPALGLGLRLWVLQAHSPRLSPKCWFASREVGGLSTGHTSPTCNRTTWPLYQ